MFIITQFKEANQKIKLLQINYSQMERELSQSDRANTTDRNASASALLLPRPIDTMEDSVAQGVQSRESSKEVRIDFFQKPPSGSKVSDQEESKRGEDDDQTPMGSDRFHFESNGGSPASSNNKMKAGFNQFKNHLADSDSHTSESSESEEEIPQPLLQFTRKATIVKRRPDEQQLESSSCRSSDDCSEASSEEEVSKNSFSKSEKESNQQMNDSDYEQHLQGHAIQDSTLMSIDLDTKYIRQMKKPMYKSTIELTQMSKNPQGHAESFDSIDSSDESSGEEGDPETRIIKKMEGFYDRNYKSFEIWNKHASDDERVWNVIFDEKKDITYVFLAKVIDNKDKSEDSPPRINHNRMFSSGLDSSVSSIKPGVSTQGKAYRVQDSLQHSQSKLFSAQVSLRGASPKNAQRFMARKLSDEVMKQQQATRIGDFQARAFGSITLKLFLHIWSVDDRVIETKFHLNKPIQTYLLFSKKIFLPHEMNSKDKLNYAQNLYQDYANLLQFDGKIHMCPGLNQMLCYDTSEREFVQQKYSQSDAQKPETIRAFQHVLHFKDLGRASQHIENIVQFTYYQQQEKPKAFQTSPGPGDESAMNQVRLMASKETSQTSFRQVSEAAVHRKWVQKIGLKMFPYRPVVRQESISKLMKMPRIKEQFINFEDESVFSYYSDVLTGGMKSIFVHRIIDSNTYIMLFPTGLLMHVSSSLLTIQAKLQLNLKKDETIVDVAYCIDDASQQNHCLWLLDEKQQVWKCTNELNPNSCNWTLSKITMLDNLFFRRFIQPAMTFDDYFETSSLLGIQCLKNIGLDESKYQEIQYAFNATATKAIVIKQARLRNNTDISEENDSFTAGLSKDSFDMNIEEDLSIDSNARADGDSSSLYMFVIKKTQTFIMNKIPERRSNRQERMRLQMQLSRKLTLEKIQRQQTAESPGLRNRISSTHITMNIMDFVNQDIADVIYLDNSSIRRRNKKDLAKFRRFIVRKTRSIELLFTNGLSQWQKHIAGTEVCAPYYISGAKLSNDKQLLLVSYSPEGQPNRVTNRIFKQKENGFVVAKDHLFHGGKKISNIFIDAQNTLVASRLEVTAEPVPFNKLKQSTTIEKTLNYVIINIPEHLLAIPGLSEKDNKFEKLLLPGNGRIQFCGRILIKLNPSLSEINDIGCIIVNKKFSTVTYKFNSLYEQKDRKEIQEALKDKSADHDRVVNFTGEHGTILFPSADKQTHFYFINRIDYLTEDTSVAKMIIENLQCFEIYQSNFRITSINQLQTSIEPASPLSLQPKTKTVRAKHHLSPIKTSEKDIMNRVMLSSEPMNQLSKSRRQTADQTNIPTVSRNLNNLNPGGSSSKNDSLKVPEYQQRKVSKIQISLMSQRRNHLVLEVITDDTKLKKRRLSFLGAKIDPDEECSSDDCCESESNSIRSQQFITPQGKLAKVGDKRPSISAISSFSNSVFHSAIQKRQVIFIQQKAELSLLMTISSKAEIQARSSICWVTEDKLLVTLNKEYFMLKLFHKKLILVKDKFLYGTQHVNADLFCSIIRKSTYSGDDLQLDQLTNESKSRGNMKKINSAKRDCQQLMTSQQSILRMNIASLSRFAFIKTAQRNYDYKRRLLFFTPCEELHGSNIFSKVSNNYGIMQPYLEIIDGDFIHLMNRRVQNIALYIDPHFQVVNGLRVKIEDARHNHHYETKLDSRKARHASGEGPDQFFGHSGAVHMYQTDILGNNAIDYAFMKNAIFCIKAFVETLLILPDEVQFRNSFDKALLLMVKRGMDVKELVNSELFYPTIWKRYTLFSPVKEAVLAPFNGDFDDLELEDPNSYFDSQNKFKEQLERMYLENSVLTRQQIKAKEKEINQLLNREQFEMQFNYIYVEEIQGSDKLDICRTLKHCQDIELFEQEAIQHIIDYKWNTYAKGFFLVKFIIFVVFLAVYYLDMESIRDGQDGFRVKGAQFIVCKSVTATIQVFFFIYELIQMKIDGREYFEDTWNYLELIGNALFFWGAALDLLNSRVSDMQRIIFSFSIMFTLIKVVYLIRVFRQLNFLVTMFITVLSDIFYFMVLFTMFGLTFAESFNLVEVDASVYGRTPMLFANFIQVLRSSMGDFAIINIFQGFDNFTINEDGEREYAHSRVIMLFTICIFLVTVFFMFMVFMNFIIALISDSYQQVIQNKEAFDYQQRAAMIYEREAHFTSAHFENKEYFPSVILVRKKKDNTQNYKSNWQGYIQVMKNYIKSQSIKQLELITVKSSEQKLHFSTSIKILENDIHNVNKDIDRIYSEICKLGVEERISFPTQFIYPEQTLSKIQSSEAITTKSSNLENSEPLKIESPPTVKDHIKIEESPASNKKMPSPSPIQIQPGVSDQVSLTQLVTSAGVMKETPEITHNLKRPPSKHRLSKTSSRKLSALRISLDNLDAIAIGDGPSKNSSGNSKDEGRRRNSALILEMKPEKIVDGSSSANKKKMKRRKTSANILAAFNYGNTSTSFDDVKTDLKAAKDTMAEMKKHIFTKVNSMQTHLGEEIVQLKEENADLKNMVKDLAEMQKQSLQAMNFIRAENLELKETIQKIEAKDDIQILNQSKIQRDIDSIRFLLEKQQFQPMHQMMMSPQHSEAFEPLTSPVLSEAFKNEATYEPRQLHPRQQIELEAEIKLFKQDISEKKQEVPLLPRQPSLIDTKEMTRKMSELKFYRQNQDSQMSLANPSVGSSTESRPLATGGDLKQANFVSYLDSFVKTSQIQDEIAKRQRFSRTPNLLSDESRGARCRTQAPHHSSFNHPVGKSREVGGSIPREHEMNLRYDHPDGPNGRRGRAHQESGSSFQALRPSQKRK